MPITIKKILTLSIFLTPAFASGTPSTSSNICESREQVIQAVEQFLEKEYSVEMAANAQVYYYPQENRARVRSYPGNRVCLGEFCIASKPCSVRSCTMEIMGPNGIRDQEFFCWIPPYEQ